MCPYIPNETFLQRQNAYSRSVPDTSEVLDAALRESARQTTPAIIEQDIRIGRAETEEYGEFRPLEQIEGIGSAEIAGGVEREIQIEVDPKLIALYGLTIDQISQRIDDFNQNLQGGQIRKGRFKYPDHRYV